MSELEQGNDFKNIVLNSTPLIDVRAPIEFEKGAFPNAINLEIMNDEERHIVGIAYKKKGNAEAMKLGYSLVSGNTKEHRIAAWKDVIKTNPQALLYCFRGGSRSRISQEWLHEAGVDIVRIKGGYKAFRNYLMTQVEEAPKHFSPIIIGGRTGSGKTILLKKVQNSIDLEKLANHRGSSFGRKVTPQPSQIDFENALAYDLIKKLNKGFDTLVFEDEGKAVGKAYLPPSLTQYLQEAPLCILETSTQERIEITFIEYVLNSQSEYEKYSDNGFELWCSDMQKSMWRIRKRLGGKRYKILETLLLDAIDTQITSNDLQAHKIWIEYLLSEYYDPMYDYQIQKNKHRIVMRGSQEEILEYLNVK